MGYKWRLSSNLVPILHKSEFDNVAADFLEKYYPQALAEPLAVPIEQIASESMNLQIRRVHLSEDLETLGQIFFNAGRAEIYLKETEEFVYENVTKGTIFIDPDVAIVRNAGSERNTVAHECVHWHIHRPYHSIQLSAGGNIAVAFRCPVTPPSEQFESAWTSEDWMEWQANGIAPKILMPKNAFTDFVEQNETYRELKNTSSHQVSALLDLLITKLAQFFQVSKQSASIRLSELDLL